MMSYNGNSGAPLFRKQGDKYYLISVIKGGRSSSPNEYHDLYGIDAQRKTTTFGKPELLQEFLIETVENRDK